MKLKKILLASAALVAAGAIITPTVTSCGSVSADIIKNMVDKGDSSKFADGYSNVQAFELAMENKTGSDAFKAKLVDDILYDWYKSKTDDQPTFKDNWKKWEKDAKKDYDDKVKSYKDDHKNDWEYYFQNDVLDPVGGTKDAYIRDKICASIRTEFTNNVFASNDLGLPANYGTSYTYKVNDDVWNGGSKDVINDSVNAWPCMDFFSNLDPIYKSNPLCANEYALIQRYTFDKYMHDVRPISTAMCLWKYSAPAAGMESIYNANKIPSSGGDDSKNTANASTQLKDGDDSGGDSGGDSGDKTSGIKESYEYPYFKEVSSPTASSKTASDKYFNFASKWATNNFIDDASNTGKINIPTEYTDDSATLMITESSTAFSSLDISFAGAVSDLLRPLFKTGDTHLDSDYLNAALAVPAKAQDTDILKNFLFANGAKPAKVGNYCVDLSKLYEFEGKATDAATDAFSSLLFTQSANNPYANTSTHQGIRYVVPAVRLTNGSTGLPYILIRDSFGVHVIGLDCSKYLETQKAKTDVWTAEGHVLKYRSMLEKAGFSTQGTGMILNDKLKTFFSSNINDIVLEMAKAGTKAPDKDGNDQTIFNKNIWGEDAYTAAILNVVENGNTFFNYYNILSTLDAANKKLFDNTTKYVTNMVIRKSGNIFNDVYSNGLACALPFDLSSGKQSDAHFFAQTDYYECTKLCYGWDTTYYPIDPAEMGETELTTAKTNYSTAINSLWTACNYQPYTDKSGSRKYSEHIIFKRDGGMESDKAGTDAVNFLFNAFGGSGNAISNIIKFNAYTSYLNDFNTADYQDALTSIYETGKVLTDNTPISFYDDSKLLSFDEFKTLVHFSYGSNTNRVIGSSAQKETNDDYINYLDTLATLKFLTKDNNKELIDILRNSLSINTSAVVAWNIKDLSTPYNADFGTKCTDEASYNNIFGYSANHLGLYDKTYQCTNCTDATIDTMSKGFSSSSNYYHFATLPYKNGSGTTASINGMGFCGVQTSSSSPDLDTEVSNIVFSKANKHLYSCIENASSDTPAANGEGCLYQYVSKDNLKSLIENNDSIDSLKNFCNDIETAIPTNEKFELIVSQVKNGKRSDGTELKTAKDYRDLILPAFTDASLNIITDDMFKGLNFKDGGLGGMQIKSDVASDGSAVKLSSGSYSRAYIIQFNYADIDKHVGDDPKAEVDYAGITTNLETLLGGTVGGKNVGQDILKTIAVQYAIKSENQIKATRDVVETVFDGKKVKVYDRRLNTQLGNIWVSDWKSAN